MIRKLTIMVCGLVLTGILAQAGYYTGGTVAFGPAATDWSAPDGDIEILLPQYAGIHALLGVRLTLFGRLDTEFTVSNDSPQAGYVTKAISNSMFTLNYLGSGLVVTLPSAKLIYHPDPPMVFVPGHTPTTSLGSAFGVQTNSQVFPQAHAVTEAFRNSGVPLTIASLTGTETAVLGGNLDIAQTTYGSGWASVEFDVENPPVPEPASLALIGIGLLGVGWVGNRRK